MPKAAPKKTSPHKPKGKQPHAPEPKPRRKAIPTLAQHLFAPPYSRLLTLGEADLDSPVYAQIAAELGRGNAQEAVARLTGIALDRSFEEYGSAENFTGDDPRIWTRVHAIGVLTQMGSAAQAALEPLLPLLDDEDDWLREEMPVFYAQMGQPAVEPLRRILQNAEADTYLRTGAGDSLEQMAEQHPELRATIVPLLEQTLIDAGEDDLLASFLVCNLLDLNAKESLPLIQQAFAEDRVDLSVVGMEDVEEHFGLVVPTEEKKKRKEEKTEAKSQKTEAEDASGENIARHEPVEETAEGYKEFAAPAPFVKPVKLGRNEPCWCGSGKKFKQCHGV